LWAQSPSPCLTYLPETEDDDDEGQRNICMCSGNCGSAKRATQEFRRIRQDVDGRGRPRSDDVTMTSPRRRPRDMFDIFGVTRRQGSPPSRYHRIVKHVTRASLFFGRRSASTAGRTDVQCTSMISVRNNRRYANDAASCTETTLVSILERLV